MITVGPEERARFKRLRLEKKLGQRELGKKVGASQGTISNLENGKHPQITLAMYVDLVRILAGPAEAQENEETRRGLMRDMVDLDGDALRLVRAVVDQLAKKK